MFKPNEREYRSLDIPDMKDKEDDYIVEGYASTFEAYDLFEIDGIMYREEIDPHAFDEADLSDVVFQVDHEGKVLARTSNGAIELSVDDHGFHHRTNLGLTSSAKEVYEDIKVGNYQKMSFSFIVREDSYDKETHTRKILKIEKVYDISAVSFPANPGTEINISTRDYFNGVIEAEKAERLESEKRKLAREKLALKMKLIGG